MDSRIRDAFDAIQTPERLKRRTKAYLRKTTLDYGRDVLRLRRRRARLAAGLLSLALMVSGAAVWYLPATSIAVDVNPSVELKVNALDRVITLRGRNPDGDAVAKSVDVTGMAYDDAVQRLLLSEGLEPYLESGSSITITVAGGSALHGEEMVSRVLCRAYNIAEAENVHCYQVDADTARAAREAGLCVPRYLAWQQMLLEDAAVTADEVRRLPKEEIHALVQMKWPDDPCGE